MATLNVTNLQNTAATVTNVSLLADGTTTLVLNATGTSRLGGLRYNAGNLEVYTAGAVWVAAGGSTYTATAPIKVTGTVISVDLGLGVAANGANLALKVPVAATPPAIGTGAAQAFDGSMYWDDTLGQLFIRYINGGTSTWVAAAPPAGGVPAASLAEAAAGVTTVKYSSPATSVPKDAANMTGAAILPSGTTAQQPATPVAGMLRMNTSLNPDSLEAYDGTTSSWRQIAYEPQPPAGITDLTISANGPLPSGSYNNVTINTGVTATVSGLTKIVAYGNVTINGSINGVGTGQKGPILAIGWEPSLSAAFSTGAGVGPGGGNTNTSYTNSVEPSGGESYSFSSFTGSSGAAGTVRALTSFQDGLQIGGSSGATLLIVAAGGITLSGSSTINVSGANGISTVPGGSPYTPGSGGGSGGLILLQSNTSVNLPAGSTLIAQGGNGAAYAGSSPCYGGGGGGGGYIVLNSPSLTNSGTITLTGGTAGASGVVPAVLWTSGSGGGGFGGKGGNGGWPSGASSAGSSGQILLNQYI